MGLGGGKQGAGRCVYSMLPFAWEEKSNAMRVYLQVYEVCPEEHNKPVTGAASRRKKLLDTVSFESWACVAHSKKIFFCFLFVFRGR